MKSLINWLFRPKPKFKVHDFVAVLIMGDPRGLVVMPRTLVVDRRFYDGKHALQPKTPDGKQVVPARGWWYEVLHDRGMFVHERHLRPYRDDDYKTTADDAPNQREKQK